MTFYHPLCVHLLPFKQLISKQVDWLWDSILECLQHHTPYRMICGQMFDVHETQMLSYFGLGVNTWLITQLVISMFSLSCAIFSIALQTRLELLHPWAFFDAWVNNKFHYCPPYVMCSWQWAYRDTRCNVRCYCNYINWSWSHLLPSTRVVAHPSFNPNQFFLMSCCHPLWIGVSPKQSYNSQYNTHTYCLDHVLHEALQHQRLHMERKEVTTTNTF